MRKNTKSLEKVISEFIEIHGSKYDYSLVEYENTKSKVKIICLEHGIFEQTPKNHLVGHGCPKCVKFSSTTEIFKEKSILVHGNIYDYSLVKYLNNVTPVKILCSEHGIFEQKPMLHLRGSKCQKCSNKYTYSTDEFIRKANIIHNNKYDYSLVDYINTKFKVKIICLRHGVFEQRANNHLLGRKCPKCCGQNRTIDEYIKEANLVHNNKYDYSLVIYKKTKDYIKIICPKHGMFKQTACSHLNNTHGCPFCNESKGEQFIENYLKNKNINFIRQHKFNDCRDKKSLPFDFYLQELNVCIEFDGIQHSEAFEYWGGEDKFKYTIKHDNIKTKYCNDNEIKLIRINHKDKIDEKMNFYFNIYT